MKVHLFGLPISAHRRLEDESGGWTDAVPAPHLFRSTPISTNEHATFTEGELRNLRTAVGEGFTHIVIPASREWKTVHARFQFDCRVHIVRLWAPMRDVTWAFLKDSLHAATKLDEVWLRKVSPSDPRHPLLLPPVIFRTTRHTEEYWHRCDIYSEDGVAEAERLLSVVERDHRKPDATGGRSWIDDRKLRFKFDPSKHAPSPTSRSGTKEYRFCYEVMPGFHYDVRDDSGKAFIIDIGGKSTTVTHCNVTPWGHVRRG
jgi:hypothetical protein